MKTICIIIGIICLYYDFSAMREPDHLQDNVQSIVADEKLYGNIQ